MRIFSSNVLPERMMAWGYPVSDCCRTASWTTLFSWGARGTALVLVKVNGFLTSVYGLIQTSMGPTFVWNAFRLSTHPRLSVRPQSFLATRLQPPHQGRCEMRLLFPSSSKRWRLFASLLRIGRVGYGCLDAARFATSHRARLIVARSSTGSDYTELIQEASILSLLLRGTDHHWNYSRPDGKKLKSNYPVYDRLRILDQGDVYWKFRGTVFKSTKHIDVK